MAKRDKEDKKNIVPPPPPLPPFSGESKKPSLPPSRKKEEKTPKDLKGIIDKESNVSSKRFIMVLTSVWALTMASYYIISVQLGGGESMTTVGLLEFAFGSAITLAVGGTVAESLKRKKE